MSPEQLFPRASRDFLTQLAGLSKHLDAAMPMRRQHRRELPSEIRHLSHLLTDERGDLRRDYLSDPAALSAYLRYFLPWNIYRLGVLFSGLALDPGGDDPDGAATIVDLGTGPLTAPLALWLSRPRLRKRPLTFICVDRAPKPMRLGLDVLNSLAAAQGGLAPWKITLVKGPLDARLREKADLIIMANALNEVLHRGDSEDLFDTADALAWHLTSMLTPTGALCVVEPGVRPSAHLMAALRGGLLHHGLKPLAPCPHTEPCPMSGRGYTAWCHFNFDAEAAPGWLKKLSDEAKLPKDNVSLSFLHFSAKGRKLAAGEGKSLVRAVSGPFELPAPDGMAPRRFGQYACSERGLTLLSLPKKHLVPMSGALIEAAWPDYPETDAKSHALILPIGGDVPTPAMRPQQDRAPSPAPRAPKRPERPDADGKRSEGKRGEPKYDDAKRGDAKRRDAKFGDAKLGDPKARQPRDPARAYEPTPRPERSPGADPAPKAQRPDKNGGPAKPMTVDSIIAAGDPGDKPAPQKRKRLPSERPADPVKPAGRPRNSGGKSAGGAPGKTSGKAKDKDKPHASRAERKATGDAPGKPSGKPTGNSAGKPTGKPVGKSSGKPSGKSTGKSSGKKPGKPKAKQ